MCVMLNVTPASIFSHRLYSRDVQGFATSPIIQQREDKISRVCRVAEPQYRVPAHTPGYLTGDLT